MIASTFTADVELIDRPDQWAVRPMMMGCLDAGHHRGLGHSKSLVSGRVQSGVSVTPFSTVTRVRMQ